MSTAEIASLPGFREFYPDDLALRSHIFEVWREVARRYGFVEYDGPPLEPLELYTRKSGEEIVGQLYAFEDKGGREVALRPEMTPTFARMIAARAAALPKPIRWYSIPQLFRYERPQRGRLREHFQLNLDVVGETDPLADAEVVAAGIDILRAFGLDEEAVVARVSDRRLVAGLLSGRGVPADRIGEAFTVLDRAEKQGEDWARDRLQRLGAGPDAASEILALGDASLDETAAALGAPGGADPGAEEALEAADRLRRFLEHMDAYGLSAFVAFDGRLVRGLAYYTGLVFELWERSGELRAVCGGGRYDDLLASLGGVDLPAVGFGMGDVVLGEILKDRGLEPSAAAEVEDFVVYVSDAERALALRLVRALRESGRRVGFDIRGRSVGRQFRAADQAGAARAFVLGPDEAERGVVLVRTMASGEEETLPLEAVLGGEAARPRA